MATQTNKQGSFWHKKLVIVLLCILVFVLIPSISAAAYAGFVPGLTEVMKTNHPVDLGVRYSAADFKQIQNSTNSLTLNVGNFDGLSKNIKDVSSGKNLVVYGTNTIQTTLSQEELTAFLNMIPWTGSPLQHSQVRLNDDGTIEFSGNVSAAYVSDLIKTLYPASDYGNLGFVARLASHLHNPAVYAKLNLSSDSNGDNNQGNLHFKMLALKVNRMDLSKDVNSMNQVNVKTGHGSEEQGVPYSLSSLSVSSGKLSYYGNAPSNFAVGNGDPGQICSNYHGGSLLSLSSVGGRIGSIVMYCQ